MLGGSACGELACGELACGAPPDGDPYAFVVEPVAGTMPNGTAHGSWPLAPRSEPKSGARSSPGVPQPVDVPPGPVCDVCDSLADPEGPPANAGDAPASDPATDIATSCGLIASSGTDGAPGTLAISCGAVPGDAGALMPAPVVNDSGVGIGMADMPISFAIRASMMPIVFGSSAAKVGVPVGASAAPASPGVDCAMLGPGLCGTPPASPRSPVCANNARSSCGGR